MASPDAGLVPRLTRDELLTLTDRDLPTLSDLLPLRMQDLPLVTRDELLTLTDRDLPSINDLPPPDLMEQEEVPCSTRCLRPEAGARTSSGDVRGRLHPALRHHSPGRTRPGPAAVARARRARRVRGREPPPAVLFAMWQEGKPPEFVMEIASISTWRRDRDEKPAIYESLGVREYFLYDPVGGRLEPRLQGHVLREGRYRALRPERLANGERGLRSETLGLWAYLQGPEQALRWHDPVTGKDLEDYEELYAAREAAEEELAELRGQSRRLGREPAT